MSGAVGRGSYVGGAFFHKVMNRRKDERTDRPTHRFDFYFAWPVTKLNGPTINEKKTQENEKNCQIKREKFENTRIMNFDGTTR